MKKIVFLAIFLLGASLAFAGNQAGTQEGNSPVNHLYLFEKDPSTWEIVDGGAWGKLGFNMDKNTFVFNGHGLMAGNEYSLVRYNGTDWPTIECLGFGTANNGGNVNIKGDDFGSYGDKVWLVNAADADCENKMLIGWNPTEYLFENQLI